MYVWIFVVSKASLPLRARERDATRSSEAFELPIVIGVQADPEHLGEREGADAMHGQPLVVAHRADAAVDALVPDLRMDGVAVGPKYAVAAVEEAALVRRLRVLLARFGRVV